MPPLRHPVSNPFNAAAASYAQAGFRHPPLRGRHRQTQARPPPVDDDLEDFDEESSSRPKRGKSRKRPQPASSSPGGIDGFTAMLIALACIMAIFSVVGSYIPMALIVPGAIGLVITLGAGFWLLIFPFNESAVQGFLCLIVPFYALFYLAAHFDEMWRPFVLQVVASLMVAGSAGLFYYLSRIPVAG